MARTATRTRPSPPQSLVASITLGGDDFPFRLYTRPLVLGPGRTVQYSWMDSTQFRITRSRRAWDPANFRNCVGHWWRAMQLQGLGRDPDQIRHLLLATTYALVSGGKALQHVYRDAYLAPRATSPEEVSLPDAARRRIRAVVLSRDRERVGAMLDEVLGRVDIAPREAALMSRTCSGILEHGLELVLRRGDDGLAEFVGRFDAWSAKIRRRGGRGWLRLFLDALSYETKISFYRCYSNVWIDLIPWLRRHRGLDEVGERFLRFWHMQNQPLELPDGRVIPDVFGGQVLALHPLSGFVMKDPGLCAVAGRFFGSDACARVMANGRAEDCAEYWDLLGAILTAAHLYRQALDEQGQQRGVRSRNSGNGEPSVTAAETRSPAGLLEEFAASRGLLCRHCGGALRVRRYGPTASDPDVAEIHFLCRACGKPARHHVGRAELEQALLP
jgi:hypothetical protein